MNTKKYDKHGLVREIVRFKNENGRMPTVKDLTSQNGMPSYRAYNYQFEGSFTEAKELAKRRL